MDDVARGPKRPVNMTLSENLVLEARKDTGQSVGNRRSTTGRIRRDKARQRIQPRTASVIRPEPRHASIGDGQATPVHPATIEPRRDLTGE